METYDNQFTNGEITVTFEPRKCIHAEKCAKGLSEVFRTTVIPWIDLDGAETEKIISQIKKCPSGALNFCYNDALVSVK
ncbi:MULTISPECIES: (4Fe-4S)-binding protein [Altibacter]|uniref:(4Fe-4S)-binding protein n=1 Tax=Altibacter TaxID=1535231 RepID=UPI00054FD08D|nr:MULTISPECIES: (4Fe-4S)-binding protein [Altibacter]MCW8982163.1 (4Fe-4S)-binding protein [Altibacter sp.]MCW9037693.1 (4Fe-4S)-binding protein [Altibacter sp.]